MSSSIAVAVGAEPDESGRCGRWLGYVEPGTLGTIDHAQAELAAVILTGRSDPEGSSLLVGESASVWVSDGHNGVPSDLLGVLGRGGSKWGKIPGCTGSVVLRTWGHLLTPVDLCYRMEDGVIAGAVPSSAPRDCVIAAPLNRMLAFVCHGMPLSGVVSQDGSIEGDFAILSAFTGLLHTQSEAPFDARVYGRLMIGLETQLAASISAT